MITETNTKGYKLLVKTVQELSMARDMRAVMKIVKTASRALSGADGTTFVLKEGDYCYYAEEEAISTLWKGKRFPIDSCISGWAMKNKQAVTIEDIYADDRIPHDAYRPTFVKSLAMIPIRIKDPIAAIGNYWANNHVPDKEEMSLLQSLADITAVTLENIRINGDLEQRVRERTRELENVNRELEMFSYSVSHDLRAPLRGINGFMSILLEDHSDKMNEEAKRLADRVLANAAHMTNLIDDLMILFKMGKKELMASKLPMKLIATEISNDLRAIEKRRYISFDIKELPDAMGDNILIKQVWSNLIGNAIKYSSKKLKSFIEIGFEKHPDEVVYYVKDNGAGFDMEYASKLFGVFQRLHSQREFEGTGIGLAIVEKIISRHGGRVWAESKVGEGATFYFTLPNQIKNTGVAND